MKRFGSVFCIAGALAAGVPAAAQNSGGNEVEARQALEAYGRCVAEQKPRESARVLSLDFTGSNFRTALRMLAADAERACARDSIGRGAMRSSQLLMAGSIAEGLLESADRPLNIRLAGAAETQAETFAPTDALAQCLARSLPDQVGELFAAGPGSDAEAAAAGPLLDAIPRCSQAAGIAQRMELTVPAVRAMIATAAFRLITKSESANA